MEGEVFTVEEAHGMIPLHPNCRCTWIPAEADSKTESTVESVIPPIREVLEADLQTALAALDEARRVGMAAEQLAAKEHDVALAKRAIRRDDKRLIKAGLPPAPTPAPPSPGLPVPAPKPVPPVPKPVPAPAPVVEPFKEVVVQPSTEVFPTPGGELIPPKPSVTKWTMPEQYRADVLGKAAKITEDPQYGILKQKAWDAYFEYQKALIESRTGALDEAARALSDAKIAQTRIASDEAASARFAMQKELEKKARDAAWDALVEDKNLVSSVALPNVEVAYSGPMEDILSLMPEGRATAQELINLNRLQVSRREMKQLGQYNPVLSRISLRLLEKVYSGKEELETIAHEFGHHISYKIHSIMRAQNAFFEKRTAGEAIKRLPGFGKDIVGKKDLFSKSGYLRSYAGRVYEDGHTPEVISVGVEMLWKDPVGFAKADPEYFDAIIRMLKGL